MFPALSEAILSEAILSEAILSGISAEEFEPNRLNRSVWIQSVNYTPKTVNAEILEWVFLFKLRTKFRNA